MYGFSDLEEDGAVEQAALSALQKMSFLLTSWTAISLAGYSDQNAEKSKTNTRVRLFLLS